MRFRQIKKYTIRILISLVLGCLSLQVFSQSDIIIAKEYNTSFLRDFIVEIEKTYNVQFFYNESDVPKIQLKIEKESSTLKEVLKSNLEEYNLIVSIDEFRNIFLTKDVQIKTDLPSTFFQSLNNNTINDTKDTIIPSKKSFLNTSKEFIAQTIIVGTKEKGVNKKYATIKGYAKNSKTAAAIIDATIIDSKSGKGTLTDINGIFSMNLSIGEHILLINSLSIKEKKLKINLLSDGEIEIFLEDNIIMLSDVEIRAQNNNNIKGTEMGIEKLSSKSVKNIPLVFGEKDIIKVALLLPGIQTIGEGSAGFNVRGSPTDQNIFYINSVPIYNTSHASGFFSAFNSDAIEEFSMYKSNIPINYGGRISSIFNIKTKQGKKDRTTASGGIGIITGRILVEGPIKKDKSSFLVGVRSTYSDWAIKMMTNNETVKNTKANFADAVTNFSFQLNEKNLLNVFFYYSKDNMNLAATNSKTNYENAGGSIVWSHYFKNNSFNLSLVHSMYNFNEEDTGLEVTSFGNSNNLQHSEINAKFSLRLKKDHTTTIGINSTLYHNNKGSYIPLSDLNPIKGVTFGKEKGLESAIYIGDEWNINEKFSVNGGLRYNLYSFLGPQDVNEYKEGLPKIEENFIGTTSYENNAFIKTYGGLDYRLAIRYIVNKNLSLKASYNKLHQYIYVLSNTIAISPNYKWKLIDSNTEPIIGEQFSIGMFTNLFSGQSEFSAEAYYKKSKNIVEIKDGADIFLTENFEQVTLQGDLEAYGIELMLKKPLGRLNGWINYTYSHSAVTVNNNFPENRINFGETYNSNYDKPHNFNLVMSYILSKRFSVSGNFVYSSGRPITYPSSFYFYRGSTKLNYSKRNAYRIPDYLRLDLSFTLEGNLKKNKLAHGSWSLSIYNVLGRNNAYSVYFAQENNKIKGYKLSIFAAPIFSLTYNFKLGNYEN